MLFSIWAVVRWVHIMAAVTWIGGQLFILLVLLPTLRKAMPAEERIVMFARVAERYWTISWVSLAVLVVSGFLNAEHRGLAWGRLLASDYGRTLGLKLLFVAVVVVITPIHSLYFGRRITRLAEKARDLGAADHTAGERRRLQMYSGMLSALNLLLNLVIVLLASALVAG